MPVETTMMLGADIRRPVFQVVRTQKGVRLILSFQRSLFGVNAKHVKDIVDIIEEISGTVGQRSPNALNGTRYEQFRKLRIKRNADLNQVRNP